MRGRTGEVEEVEEVLLLTLLNSVGIIEYKSATVSLLSVFLLPFSLHLSTLFVFLLLLCSEWVCHDIMEESLRRRFIFSTFILMQCLD